MLKDLIESDGSLSSKMPIYIRNNKDDSEVIEMLQSQGKTTTQKIYNFLNENGKTPKCTKCGKSFAFLGFQRGYASCSCSSDKELSTQRNSVSETDLEKIEKFGAVQYSATRDYAVGGSCTSSIVMKDEVISNDELLKRHGFDPEKWSIEKASSSKWEQQSKNGIVDLVSSKITVKQKTAENLSEEDIRRVFKEIAGYTGSAIGTRADLHTSNKKEALVIPIADFHYGLLSELGPTNEVYNTEIAAARLTRFVDDIIKRTKDRNFEFVLLTLGNDFFNADTLTGTTAKGTPQDQEMGYIALFKKGFQLCLDVISILENRFKYVKIASVQANHDKVTSYFLMSALYQRFKDSKNIQVLLDSAEKPRFYLRYGKNLLGFGHDTKIKDAPSLMACEAKNCWDCDYKTFFIAHLHSEEVYEDGSVVVRRLPILSSSSAWAEEKGFKNTGARGQAFIFDAEHGLKDILNFYA